MTKITITAEFDSLEEYFSFSVKLPSTLPVNHSPLAQEKGAVQGPTDGSKTFCGSPIARESLPALPEDTEETQPDELETPKRRTRTPRAASSAHPALNIKESIPVEAEAPAPVESKPEDKPGQPSSKQLAMQSLRDLALRYGQPYTTEFIRRHFDASSFTGIDEAKYEEFVKIAEEELLMGPTLPNVPTHAVRK